VSTPQFVTTTLRRAEPENAAHGAIAP
jgi:hypothetical protein